MKGYTSENIRNVALLVHGGCGKTTFLEAALLATGVINRMGRVEDGNTVSDYDKMEIEKGYSINTSVVPIIWKENKINFIDFKDADLLKKFQTEKGRILPRRITGTCLRHQKMLSVAVKRARIISIVL